MKRFYIFAFLSLLVLGGFALSSFDTPDNKKSKIEVYSSYQAERAVLPVDNFSLEVKYNLSYGSVKPIHFDSPIKTQYAKEAYISNHTGKQVNEVSYKHKLSTLDGSTHANISNGYVYVPERKPWTITKFARHIS